MSRLGHGSTTTPNLIESFSATIKATAIGELAVAQGLVAPSEYGRMFKSLEGFPENFLPENADTVRQLRVLAEQMSDTPESAAGLADNTDGPIPAAFTYFGQFLDHDVTKEDSVITLAMMASDDPQVLGPAAITKNVRSSSMDLDSVYGAPAPKLGATKMLVGPVSDAGPDAFPTQRPVGKSNFNDLPRQGTSKNPLEDRAAIIGDPRNDENTVVAQLHTAFLKAHNTLADQLGTFEAAQSRLVKIYQSIALNEYLDHICGTVIAADVREKGPKHFKIADGDPLFMPVEFSGAAFRFGHSMVRTEYDFNLNFNRHPTKIPATLNLLFTFTALSGQLGGGPVPTQFDQLPDNWIIQWENFIQLPGMPAPQPARKIDTMLTEMLFELKNVLGDPDQGHSDSELANPPLPPKPPALVNVAKNLAKRNLMKGYILGLPTGQAVARAMGLIPLEGEALIAALPPKQRAAADPFKSKTPLWFYILAEAGDPNGPNGKHLGPVGGRIVAESIWNFVRHAKISVLRDPEPEIPSTLAQLIALAEVQDQ